MGNFLLILQIVNQLFPLVIQTVKVVEDGFPQGGKGAIKLEMVRATLQAAYQAEQNASVAFDAIWPALSAIIAGVVKLQTKA